MSIEYDIYLKKHINAVVHNVSWFFTFIDETAMDEIFPDLKLEKGVIMWRAKQHDASKYRPDEYAAYDRYFYQDGKNSAEGRAEFDLAFLAHIHRNPHHWQHWVLIDDDGFDNIDGHQVKALDIPDTFIIDMIADWWSFSYNEYLAKLESDPIGAYEKLYGIFDWYNDHRSSIIFSTTTRNKVERFLDVLKHTLDIRKPL